MHPFCHIPTLIFLILYDVSSLGNTNAFFYLPIGGGGGQIIFTPFSAFPHSPTMLINVYKLRMVDLSIPNTYDVW